MSNAFHNFSKPLTIGLVSLGAVFALGACGDAGDVTADPVEETPTVEAPAEEEMTAAETGSTVVDIAASDESFSTLVTALEAAGLDEVLAGEGPYTVFAPTNEAFAALPEGVLEELLLPENQALLTQILAYHVVPAEVLSADVTSGEAPTAAGVPLSITVDDTTGEIMIDEATVIQADVLASNGVIHGIDQVLLPPDVAL
ncbi:fasciclin domain-containing protein [Leptolyngbya sp. PCC 6406]|uniref:fasciclin domain-containing protein n=1 Tax=Leptolyngbya sp. PCC 6406 TaxID=1173264 RepID=UPI0002ACED7E|nr:fasciclin domain-containing protein [Leptolyngbya sp. PCC 6406]